MKTSIAMDFIERKPVKCGNGAHIQVPKEWLDSASDVVAFRTKHVYPGAIIHRNETKVIKGKKHFYVELHSGAGTHATWMTKEALKKLPTTNY